MNPTLTLALEGRVLIAEWPDRVAQFAAGDLRAACRCAWCTRARRANESVGEADAITELDLMGGPAVHLIFSDGHRTGVFPFAYLRVLSAPSPTTEALP